MRARSTPRDTVIRLGRAEDLPALLRLYNHYVETSHVTFDPVPLTLEARQRWFATFSEDGPHRLLVADLAGEPVAYATSGPHRPKPGYRTSVETTIYVGADHLGRGLGRPLYAALLAHLDAEPGVHRALAGIALPNEASIALHEALGFTHLGTFREVGTKFGRYWDVAWYERDCSGRPASG